MKPATRDRLKLSFFSAGLRRSPPAEEVFLDYDPILPDWPDESACAASSHAEHDVQSSRQEITDEAGRHH
jgi:hypothetical protein